MNCQTCGRLMRKSRETAAQRPDAVSYGRKGQCAKCYAPLRKISPPVYHTRGFKEAQAIAAAPANRESLAAYLKWRAPYRQKAGTQ